MNIIRVASLPTCATALLLIVGCGTELPRAPRLSVPLPFGIVDSLGEARADGTLRLSGWVLSEDPVQTVALYIDRRYVTSARLHQPRPDVNKVYPVFGAVNAGWIIDLDTDLFRGEHEIVVQARTAHGAVRDLHAARVSIGNGNARPL